MNRRFLFLQGTMSPFFRRVGEEVELLGAKVWRINFCVGDWLFWNGRNTVSYRGRQDEFEAFVDRFIAENGITDVVYFGDSRAYHRIGSKVAQNRGLRVHAIEFGYLRPNWLTLEPDGMSSLSRFPSVPDDIRKLAIGKPPPPPSILSRSSFLREAIYDLVYNVPNFFLGPFLFPHYRRPGVYHPMQEYWGWITRFVRSRRERRLTTESLDALRSSGAPYFLFPLQLATDFQIRTHSPFPSLWDAVEWVVKSFAANAPSDTRLLLKMHPLDNGLIHWRKRLAELASLHGMADRLHFADGGDLREQIDGSKGVITINSTTGLYALKCSRPVVVLGSAVYDINGLTHQGSLASFWQEPEPIDGDLLTDFITALAWSTQLRGGALMPQIIDIGAVNLAERMMEPDERLPAPRGTKSRHRGFRRKAEWMTEMGRQQT